MDDPRLKLVKKDVKIYFGFIKGSALLNSKLTYRIFIEGYHTPESEETEYATGIPTFNMGISSVRYRTNDRVLVLVEGVDFKTCFIIGQVSHPKDLTIQTNPFIKSEGNVVLGSDKAGLHLAGEGVNATLWGGTSSIILNNDGLVLKTAKGTTALGNSEVVLDSKSGKLSIAPDLTLLFSNNPIKIASKNGSIDLFSTAITLDAGGGKTFIKGSKDLFISATSTSISTSMFKLAAGSSSAAGSTNATTIDLSVIKGNFGISTGAGKINISTLTPGVGEINLDVGPSALPATFMTLSASKVKISTKAGKITINTGPTALTGAKIEMSPSGLITIASSPLGGSIELSPTGKVTIKGSKIARSSIVLDSTGNIILKHGPAGKVKVQGPTPVGTGELTAGLEVTAKEVYKLTTHKHLQAIPGPPSVPLPG